MLRLATKEDLPAIAHIEKTSFAIPWTLEMLAESFDGGCKFLVVQGEGEIIGYAGLYSTGDITNIAVLPSYRGKGYGKQLVEGLLQLANKMSLDGVFLEVRVSNLVAIKLYEKCGFKLISTRKKYYKDGEDALIYAFGGV